MTNLVRHHHETASVTKAGCLLHWGPQMIRKLIHLIFAAMLVGAAVAQDVSIRADHPEEYVVQKGDTLWDIAARFLDKPWQWPAIWHANPQVENPHLIYPGDRLSLVYEDGRARLAVNGEKPVERLSPGVRSTVREPVKPIPLGVLKPFIKNARVITPAAFDGLPYVVANYEQRMNATISDRTYVRGLAGAPGQEFSIMRLGNIYYRLDGEMRRGREPQGYGAHLPQDLEVPSGFWRPVDTWGQKVDIIGYELYEVGRAVLAKNGDPAILEIFAGQREIRKGDLVLAVDDYAWDAQFMPRPLEPTPEGMHVLAIEGGNYGVGQLQMLAISGGTQQGVRPGHVFSAFTEGATIRDSVKYPAGSMADASTWNGDKVTLPAEYNAHIMIIRVFDEVSYAMVMDGARLVKEGDVLRHPDEKL